jgi:hypothetical protein
MEHGFEAARLNTSTMTELAGLAEALLANFRTVRIPASETSAPTPEDFWAVVKARRTETRAAYAFRDRIRRELTDHGHRFLNRLEADPDGGRRLHIFVTDDCALRLLDEITDGACGPGDPVTLDREEFVSERLGRPRHADDCS